MAQPWFVSPLGKLIGDPTYGGDIGFELALAFSALAYPPARYLERKYWKRTSFTSATVLDTELCID